jgi:glycosyltransferase involved in cell wall biosynthesis
MTLNEPIITVVIPVYNGEAYLAEAVESVLAQTWPALEVIAVDDGSTDRSAEIIAGWGSQLVAIHQENRGVAAARNAGIQRAGGQFVAFLDQDDWWLPEKIEKQLAVFHADDRIGLVHTGVDHYDQSSGRMTGPLAPDARPELMVGDCLDRLLLGNPVYNSSVAVRASVLREVGLCDTEIRGNTVQDYDLWLRIARRAAFGFVPEPLVVFRVHEGQGTWDRRPMLSEEARLLERVIAAEGAAARGDLRRRMADLYRRLGTAHLDAGDRGLARRSFARSLRWHATAGAAVRWAACLLPAAAIRRLQAARARRRSRNSPVGRVVQH